MPVHTQIRRANQRQRLPVVSSKRQCRTQDLQRWMGAVEGAVDKCVSQTVSSSVPCARPWDADIGESPSTCILNGGEPDGVDRGNGHERG